MTGEELVKACLMTTLNASLRFQGILDVVVFGLSDDFKVALIRHMKNGKVIAIGAVQAELLLS
jgi:hypothetical protein